MVFFYGFYYESCNLPHLNHNTNTGRCWKSWQEISAGEDRLCYTDTTTGPIKYSMYML